MLLLCFLVFLFENRPCFSSLLSTSKVQKCYNSSTSMNCSEKILVSLSLENAQMTGSETLNAFLTELKSENNSKTNLKTPLKISMGKSQVFAIYDLNYLQDFNNKPMEDVIESNVFSCEADFYDSNPTCGFVKNAAGTKILYSQGFCCKCSWLDILGLDNEELTRGKICKTLNIASGSATAHCLRFDDLWYSAFTIPSPKIYYTLDIILDQFSNNGTLISSSSLTLSPFRPVSSTLSKNLIAKIVGDFYPSIPPLDLSSYYLFRPSKPESHPRVLQGVGRWMFIDRSDITKDGSECNKIGVSYEAFQNEGNKCEKIVGSCLKNQIEDLNSEDLIRMEKGEKPKYFIAGMGEFLASQNTEQVSLIYKMKGTFSTMVTLEIMADEIEFITNLGSGDIDYISIPPFETLSNKGEMMIQITSTAALVSEFVLSLTCDASVSPIPSSKFFLSPLQSKLLTIELSTNSLKESNHTCTISLYDSIGNLCDNKNINFTSWGLNSTNNQDGANSSQNASANQPMKKFVDCTEACNLFDLLCNIGNDCSDNIWKSLLVLGLGSFLSLATCWTIKKKGICFLFSCIKTICSYCPSSKTEKTKRNNKQTPSPTTAYTYRRDQRKLFEDMDLSRVFDNRNKNDEENQMYSPREDYAKRNEISNAQNNNNNINNSNSSISSGRPTFELIFLNVDVNFEKWRNIGFKKSFSTKIFALRGEKEISLFLTKDSELNIMIEILNECPENFLNKIFEMIESYPEMDILGNYPKFDLL